MNILERTTTEEYDEDGRLTSRTTVEKYAPEAATDKERAIFVLENEAECVRRQSGNGCGRKCEQCDLVLADSEVLAAYDVAIKALAPKTADAMLDAIKELPVCEVEELFHMLCTDMKKYHHITWASETMSEAEKHAKACQATAFDNNVTAYN